MTLQEHIQRVGREMVAILSRQMKAGKIALSRAREIARFYLDKIRVASSEQELQQDLDVMEKEIPEMRTVVEMERARTIDAKEQDIKKQVEDLLQQGKVEEAAALAKKIHE